MPIITPPITSRKCPTCGSEMVQVDEVTEVIENHRFPVTTTTFRCSDDDCQEDTDKKTAARLKHIKEQEKARDEREKARTEALRLKKLLKASEK